MTDTPETDILEAMARAIAAEAFDDSVKEFGAEDARERNEYIEDRWPACTRKARAALTAALDQMREPLSDDAVETAAEAYHETVKQEKARYETSEYKEAGLKYRGVVPVHWIESVWQAMLSQLRKEALDDE